MQDSRFRTPDALLEHRGEQGAGAYCVRVFNCGDAYDLWTVKQMRKGTKGQTAIAEARRLREILNDHSFWDILLEAYKVSISIIKLIPYLQP